MARFLTEDDVGRLLTMPMALDAVETVMAEMADGAAQNIPRERLRTPGTTQHLLQGLVPSEQAVGYKVYTISQGVVRFLLHVYDTTDGHLAGILQAQTLGMMRTGAASGVATRHLARTDAAVLGVFGSGRQAVGQIEAVCHVRPIREVKVHARDPRKLAAFCDAMSRRVGIRVRPAESAEDTVRGSDIVTTITTSDVPVFDGAWLAPGTHVNAAGANMLSKREVDETTLQRCNAIVVDSRAVAQKECGDLLPLLEKGRLGWGDIHELGEVITGRRPGRRDADDITCFESLGLAIQDIIVGARLLPLAHTQGLGTDLPVGI